MPITHKFVSGKAASTDATIVDGPKWDAIHNAPSWSITLNALVLVLTNQASGLTEVLHRRVRVDLTQATECRMQLNVAVVGTSTAVLRVMYATDNATFVNFGALADVNLSLASTGLKSTAWLPLPAGAMADIYLAIASEGGDGAADPQVGTMVFQYR